MFSGSQSRFYSKVAEQISAGNSRIYLYGQHVKDELFYNSQGHISNLTDSLCFHLLRTPPVKYEKIIVLSSEHAFLCTKNRTSFDKKQISNAGEVVNFLVGDQKKGSDGLAGLGAKRKSSSSEASEAKESSEDVKKQTNNLNMMVSTINSLNQVAGQVDSNFAIIFDSFDWDTKLFASQQHNFELLKKTLNFGDRADFKNAPCCIYILNNIAALKDYVVDVDKLSNGILLSLPGADELNLALYEVFGRKKEYKIKSLEKVAKTSRSAQKTLRESINILREIQKQGGESEELDMLFRRNIGFPLEDWSWDDVFLRKEVKQQLIRFFRANSHVQEGEKSLGCIVYGPPGTGKTTIAKVLANTEDRSLITAKLADLKGEYVGQSAPKIRDLFDSVRSAAPSLLFLDEIETIFPAREGTGGDSFTKDLVTQFLAESDGVFADNKGLIIVGATNHIDMVDSAILSRLVPVKIDLPDKVARKEILKSGLRDKWSDISEPTVSELLERTQGCSGRELKNNIIQPIINNSAAPYMDNAAKDAVDQLKVVIANNLSAKGSGFNLIATDPNGICIDDIIGHQKIKDSVISDIQYFLNPVNHHGVKLPADNGFLFYGPPGNGKTQFANAIANHFEMDMVEVNLQHVIGGKGNPVSNLNDIFDKTVRYSILTNNGVLLFFDEFDALASKSMTNFRDTFLKRIDGIRRSGAKVLVFAATNFYHSLDEAIIRPGRFDCHYELANPSGKDLAAVFKRCIEPQFSLAPDVTDNLLVQLLTQNFPVENLSFSAVKRLVIKIQRDVLVQSAREGRSLVVSQDHILFRLSN